jgi:hypothetical protein
MQSLLDEGILIVGNDFTHVRSQPISQNLGDQFSKGVNQTYRSKVRDFLSIGFFGISTTKA